MAEAPFATYTALRRLPAGKLPKLAEPHIAACSGKQRRSPPASLAA